ncbi:MAG: winged helix-turn-helix transcriptional regulator [Methylotenera sp.]|jgi:Lrp/AsnC family leucine-responsive transcriptional regulator|nr:winged helix-turn-helix transcriptional regulator [Methylotenera sp.]PKO54006.1 MAG: AsnC family transcriptional regulator [Betaproteobacteria bacterium HGW-Betaproteobacteria-20]
MRIRTHAVRELDRIDHKILAVLQENARIPVTELAERVGLSVTPCGERVKNLEKEGVILGYHARLDPHALGLKLLVFVELKLSTKSGAIFSKFKQEILKLPSVLECHLVSGDFDYLVKARITQMTDYRTLLGDILLSLPGAQESRSYIVMEEVKEGFALPLNEAKE